MKRLDVLKVTIFLGVLLCLSAGTSLAAPSFSKSLIPGTIGPGSASTLTYTITNELSSPISDLAFTQTLPADVTLAAAANASSDCLGIQGTLTADNGGSLIELSGGSLAGLATCTVTVDITSSTPATYTIPSITLSSSDGSTSDTDTILTVSTTLPGFSKSFAPSSVSLGGRSTLTLTIDNSANGNSVDRLDFTDTFPTGMIVADPPYASTDCGTDTIPPELIANAGESTITLFANGFSSFPAIAAGAICSVSVDVVSTASGELINTVPLLATFGNAGKATNFLEVTTNPLLLSKSFTDDPAAPGGTATLDFTISNFNRSFSATNVTFTDDLEATLTGLTIDSFPDSPCGSASVLSYNSGILELSSGTIAPESSCTFSAILNVPSHAAAGSYPNTTGPVTGVVDGSPITGNAASDTLFVSAVPLLTKEFVENPATPGDTVTLRFTITNTDPASAVTDIAFTDDISGISGASPDSLPSQPCGGSSFITWNGTTTLSFSGGTLAAGDECTFNVPLQLSTGITSGTYVNTTSTVTSSKLDAPGATDSLVIVAAPPLTKEFTDDPVAPGASVTLEFTLSHPAEATSAATGITFTDDLTNFEPDIFTVSNLIVDLSSTPDPPCGVGSSLTESNNVLTMTDGYLDPGESCTFSVTLDIAADVAPGNYVNTTSVVNATVDGLAVTSNAVTDDLKVSGLNFSKQFIGDPVIPGENLALRFTLENIHPTDDASSIVFSDNLSAVLSGLTVSGTLPATPCGPSSSITGTSFLIFSGGELAQGASCTFDIPLSVPLGTSNGDYTNITSNLSAEQPSGSSISVDPAVDTLTVDSTLLQITKEFIDDPVAPGDNVTLEFVISNRDPARTATSVSFADDLNAALTGLTFDTTPISNTCTGASIAAVPDSSTIDISDVSLSGGESCTIRFSLSVPNDAAAGIYPNMTSGLTGTMDSLAVTGDAASDDLEILQLLTFSKSFTSAASIGGTATLRFTITNPGTETATGIAFTDDLSAVIPGLVATGLPPLPCGSGSSISGTSLLTFTGGELSPSGSSCTFDVEVKVPVSASDGNYSNTTSNLTTNGLKVADPATASLTVVPPPAFSKVFSPDTMTGEEVSSLTFTIDNTSSLLDATALDFTDNFPSGITIADTPNASTTCTGGTITAAAETGTISYTGGTVGANATCTVTVDVTSSTSGTYDNITGDLTSSSHNSGTATDTLTIVPPPTFTKTFAPDIIATDNTSTITFTIDNSSSVLDASDLGFTDNLPAGVVVASTPNSSTTCTGGTLAAAPETGTINYSGGSVNAGAACTVSVDVTSSSAGTHINTTGSLTSSSGNSGPASDTLTVAPPPTFAKVFSPGAIVSGGVSTLTFTIDNSGSGLSATGLDFTDTLPARLFVANIPNASTTCTGGSLTATAGATTITYGGGTVPNGATCTISVDITGSFPGTHINTTGSLSSSSGNSGTASDTLIVVPAPAFTKTFSPGAIVSDDTSTLTFTIDNSNSVLDATALDFTDNLPTGIVVATSANASTTCTGGTLAAIAGSETISYTGGSVAAAAMCTIQVDVTSSTIGIHTNTTSDLTSSLGNSGTAADNLEIVPLPTFSKQFSPDFIASDDVSTLSFTINNSASSQSATNLDFTDNLPAEVVVATPANASTTCTGGTLTAVDGSGSISYTGGMVAAGTTCTVQVDVISSTVGTHTSVTGDLTSSWGNSGTAADNLVVVPPPTFSKQFSPGIIASGDVSTLTFTINNSASSQSATSLDFTDNLPAEVVVATPANASTTCTGGTLTAVDGSGSINYTGGTVAAGATCTVQVDVTSSTIATYTNTTSDLTSSWGNSGTAADSLEIVPLPTFSKQFSPDIIASGDVSTLTFTIDNSASSQSATSLDFTDNLPAEVVVATPANASTTCTGGALTAVDGSGSISYTGGSVAAGTTCTVQVDVISNTVGTHTSVSGDLTSSWGNSGTAADNLEVVPPPTFAKLFVPNAIAPGDVSTLSFAINNSASSLSATNLEFTDNLPAEVIVATPANASTTCTGGTLTAANGSGSISYTGGTTAAGTTCTVQVDVISSTVGIHANITSDLTSSLGNSGTAADDLEVVPTPTFSKLFAPNAIASGDVSTLTFTIDNSASFQSAASLEFTDNLPAEVVVATPANASTTCTGGTLTAVDGSGSINYTGGSVAAGATCRVQVDVISSTFGSHVNVADDLTSSWGNSGTATDTLEVDAPPAFSKSFSPSAIAAGGVSTLTFTINNSDNSLDASSLDFTDNLPTGIVVATPANAATDCSGGTLTTAPETDIINYTGGTAGAGSTCTIQVNVTGQVHGIFNNRSDDLTSSLGNSGSATDSLVIVAPPLFSKHFTPNTTPPGAPSTLSFIIDNSASALPANNLDFTDNLPASLVVENPAGVDNSCSGGTLTASPGTGIINYSGGSILAGTTCEIRVNVTSDTIGTYVNITDSLTSDTGNSGSATATLYVKPFPWWTYLPAILKGFSDHASSEQQSGSTDEFPSEE